MKLSNIGFFCSIGLFLGLFTACESNSSNTIEASPYFNLKDFLENQAVMLDSLKPSVEKIALDEKSPTPKKFKVDDWKRELRLFIETNINRPVYIGQYSVDSSKSNPQKVIYKAKTDDLSTRSIEIFYNQDAKLDSIKIFYKKQNWLYGSERDALLTFEQNAAKENRLKNYRVKGFQSTIFGTRQDYEVVSKVLSDDL
jgi:hypothetical protein